jgi:hypothetical protein
VLPPAVTAEGVDVDFSTLRDPTDVLVVFEARTPSSALPIVAAFE